MQRYIILFSFTFFLLACKEDDKLVYKREQVTGNATLMDPFNESLTIPASGATIYLAENDKADPFLYSVTADDKGKFVFSGLPKDNSDAVLVGKFKSSAGITYVGNLPVNQFHANSQTELQLQPQYPGGVLKFQLTDATADKTPIAGAEILLFTTKSQTLAAADADPKGVVQKTTTNANGIAFFHSLQDVIYYVVAKNIINGKAILSEVREVPVNSTTIVTQPPSAIPLTLAFSVAIIKGSIQLTLKDSLDLPVVGFNAYLFTNPQQAETIYDEDGAKGFAQAADATTDRNGVARFSNVDPGTYYIAISGAYSKGRKIKKVLNLPPIQVSTGSPDPILVANTIN